MGLYLCVFDDEDELEGVEVGAYGDFGLLRDTIQERLERGGRGSRFPVLMLHSDCDGSWTPADAAALREELRTVARELRELPPMPLPQGWQQTVARATGLVPANLADCFFDVDGEPLLDRLIDLCRVAIERDLPILFQ